MRGSAGLVWMHGASDSGIKGVFDELGPEGLESRPTISLFELWEYGSYLPKLVIARNYSFPKSLIVPCKWVYVPEALSLRCSTPRVPTRRSMNWGQPHINMVAGIHFPNQLERNPGSILSDPLTYWWGVTLCPPELNDVLLAKSVVLHMRFAAIREMRLNTEVQKPSVESNVEPRSSPESGNKTVQPAQPDRLQQANRSDGQWSKWARHQAVATR